jgi:hypothetical protein
LRRPAYTVCGTRVKTSSCSAVSMDIDMTGTRPSLPQCAGSLVFLAHLETTDATCPAADFERRPRGEDWCDARLLLGRRVVGSVHRSHLGVPRRGVLQAVATTQVGVEPLPPCNTSSSSVSTAPEHVIAAFRSACQKLKDVNPDTSRLVLFVSCTRLFGVL